jgi:small GTP-binding protein
MVKNVKIKMILLGDSYSGKTSVLNRYVNNTFSNIPKSTIGVDFFKVEINKNESNYNIYIWDTSGQEKFDSIIRTYYRNITVVLLLFDMSNLKSFNNILNWIDNIEHYCHDNIIIKLVGNKCDIKSIDKEMINKLCLDNNLSFLEVSAKNNINITSLFNTIIDEIDDKVINRIIIPNKDNGLSIIESFKMNEVNKQSKKNNCCSIL